MFRSIIRRKSLKTKGKSPRKTKNLSKKKGKSPRKTKNLSKKRGKSQRKTKNLSKKKGKSQRKTKNLSKKKGKSQRKRRKSLKKKTKKTRHSPKKSVRRHHFKKKKIRTTAAEHAAKRQKRNTDGEGGGNIDGGGGGNIDGGGESDYDFWGDYDCSVKIEEAESLYEKIEDIIEEGDYEYINCLLEHFLDDKTRTKPTLEVREKFRYFINGGTEGGAEAITENEKKEVREEFLKYVRKKHSNHKLSDKMKKAIESYKNKGEKPESKQVESDYKLDLEEEDEPIIFVEDGVKYARFTKEQYSDGIIVVFFGEGDNQGEEAGVWNEKTEKIDFYEEVSDFDLREIAINNRNPYMLSVLVDTLGITGKESDSDSDSDSDWGWVGRREKISKEYLAKIGETQLGKAVKTGQPETVKVLLDSGNESISYKEKNAALLIAATLAQGDYDKLVIMQLLLEKGANVNIQHQQNKRRGLLHIAADEGDLGMVQLLIDNRADVNTRTFLGQTPLNYAIKSDNVNNLEIVELLINNGALIEYQNLRGNTALHIAAQLGRKEIVEFLINNGANVNVTNTKHGTTPLHDAINKGYEEIAELLIANGANVNESVNN